MPKLPPPRMRWLLEDPDSSRLRRNYPALWADPNKSCITCHFERTGEKTFRWWNEDRTEIVTWECDCTAQWILHRYMLSNGVDLWPQRLGWSDAVGVPQSTQAAVFDYLDHADAYVDRGINMILHSPDAGTGKTLMLTLTAKGLMHRGHDVFVAQMNKIVEMYTDGWQSPEDKHHFERRIINCKVLVLDDLGKEIPSSTRDFVDRLIDRVIRTRTAASAPTLITTNYTPDQLQESYNRYVASLLTESGIFIETSGTDFRPRMMDRKLQEAREGLTRPVVLL